MASIKHAQRGDVPLNYVMDIGGHDLDKVEIEVSLQARQACDPHQDAPHVVISVHTKRNSSCESWCTCS